MLSLPFGCRNPTDRLIGKIDARCRAESVLLNVVLKRSVGKLPRAFRAMIEKCFRYLVEYDVTAVDDAAMKIERTVAFRIPALLYVSRAEAVP